MSDTLDYEIDLLRSELEAVQKDLVLTREKLKEALELQQRRPKLSGQVDITLAVALCLDNTIPGDVRLDIVKKVLELEQRQWQ